MTTPATTTTETPTEPAPTEPAPKPTEPEETFPRAVVEELRRENANYRDKAKRTDALAERLMTSTVREATAGILADPTDLVPTDALLGEDGMPDPERIAEAARELIARKPHLADRRPRGDADQGARTSAADVDLAGMLRSRA